MVATLSVFWAIFKYGGPMYSEWANGQIDKVRGILNAAREDHTSAVQKRIDNVKQLSSVIEVTKQLFELSKVCYTLSKPNQTLCSSLFERKPLS